MSVRPFGGLSPFPPLSGEGNAADRAPNIAGDAFLHRWQG
jgi:hypothetical protein